MQKLTIIAIAALVLLGIHSVYAQDHDVSRFFDQLNDSPHDTTRVNIYYSISKFYWFRHADSSLLFAQKAQDLAEQIDFKKGIALSLMTKGTAYNIKGLYPEALESHLQALSIGEELGLTGMSGNNYNNIGIVYTNLGNYPKALEYFEKSLAIAQEYSTNATFQPLVNIAEIHIRNKQYDLALQSNVKALGISQTTEDSAGMAITMFNIGDIYRKKGEFLKAQRYVRESLKISQKINDIEGIAYCYNSLAHVQKLNGSLASSIQYAEMSLRQSEPLGNKELMKDSYSILYSNYRQSGNFEKALHYRDREIGLKDSMFSIEKENAINSLQATYDLQAKQHEIDLLNKDRIIREEELTREKYQRYTFIAGVVLLSVLALYLVRNNSMKHRKNRLLRKQNEEILRQKEEISMQKIRLEELNAMKSRLLTIISHDFRSPLHSLQSVVSMIELGALTEEERKQFSIMAGEKLATTIHLLENLLQWTRSQMEGEQVTADHFDFAPIVNENIRLMRNQADQKKVQLVNRLNGPVHVFADKGTVDIVLRNLTANAIKFSKAGDIVTVSAEDDGSDFVRVTVRDTGMGIAVENQSKIFRMTDTFTTQGTSLERGTGLGLILCKELIEKNNGKIWFSSIPGKGTSFMFALPKGYADRSTLN